MRLAPVKNLLRPQGRARLGGRIPVSLAFFGVNISGPEFPVSHANHAFPSTSDWNYLKSKSVKTVRLPIAWEQLQPTLSGALDTTCLNGIKAALAAAAARGMLVIVDLHNFGRWDSSYATAGYPGQAGFVLGSAQLTQAMFVDVWTRLATALVGLPGLGGYDIMNEPHDLAGGTNLLRQPNGFSGSNWFPINGAAVSDNGDGTWNLTSGTGFGAIGQAVVLANVQYTISCTVSVAAGTDTVYFNNDGASIGTATVTTTPTRVSKQFTPTAGSHNIFIGVNSASGHTIKIKDAQLEVGGSATTYVPAPWYPHAQAAVTAIRAIDAATTIYVCGDNFSSARNWAVDNPELSITGSNIVYEAHQYFDASGSGTYSQSYDAQGATPTSGVTDLAPFLSWVAAKGVTGYLGEFGVPNDDPRWVTLLSNALASAHTAGVRGAEWFYGAFSAQDTGRLNICRSANGGVDAPQIATLVFYR